LLFLKRGLLLWLNVTVTLGTLVGKIGRIIKAGSFPFLAFVLDLRSIRFRDAIGIGRRGRRF
jgi:hypothetical protein